MPPPTTSIWIPKFVPTPLKPTRRTLLVTHVPTPLKPTRRTLLVTRAHPSSPSLVSPPLIFKHPHTTHTLYSLVISPLSHIHVLPQLAAIDPKGSHTGQENHTYWEERSSKIDSAPLPSYQKHYLHAHAILPVSSLFSPSLTFLVEQTLPHTLDTHSWHKCMNWLFHCLCWLTWT